MSGFSYLPRFIGVDEARTLVDYFAGLHPLWEKRFADGHRSRRGATGRLTRPVYWLGAWQFAALGYYAEPEHLVDKCVRAEPLPPVMTRILERLRPELVPHGDDGPLPNTCLINYYGHQPKRDGKPPLDFARLRMHRDAEPGAVVMFSVGQPAQFEFVDPEAATPEHSLWVRDTVRSPCWARNWRTSPSGGSACRSATFPSGTSTTWVSWGTGRVPSPCPMSKRWQHTPSTSGVSYRRCRRSGDAISRWRG
ncbi:MAG: alpha-ketoglutarate-dependent dioxygenase AlkB [Deltaproteobacteria bacterium]|nr:alpha-ketoglutarate-dependent dioxygenase AlkB [Deltaproteobacteria bacterium]